MPTKQQIRKCLDDCMDQCLSGLGGMPDPDPISTYALSAFKGLSMLVVANNDSLGAWMSRAGLSHASGEDALLAVSLCLVTGRGLGSAGGAPTLTG